MKKYCMLLSVILLTVMQKVTVSAQNYHPMLSAYNEWDIYVNMIPIVNKNLNTPYSSGSITTSDTLIGSVQYKKVYSMTDDSLFSNGKPRFIREDTLSKKVYLLSADSINERMLYDFSLQVGDSTYLEFLYPSAIGFGNGYYKVDSITAVNTIAGVRNVFHLTSSVNQTGTFPVLRLEWIESIGSTISPVYLDEDVNYGPPAAFFTGCDDFFLALTCAFADGMATYHDSCMASFYNLGWPLSGDSCIFNFVGGYSENYFSELNLSIQPNPVIHSALIKIFNNHTNMFHSLNLKLVDVLGRVHGQYNFSNFISGNEIKLDIDDKYHGIYFLQVYVENSLKTVGKIVIE